MKSFASSDYEVLILAPFGGDAEAAAEVLRREGFRALPLVSMFETCQRLSAPAGALLVADEALTLDNLHELKDKIAEQEAWSNLPVILMTSQMDRLLTTESILDLFGKSGSVSLLERPFRILTLVSAVRVALQARQKQYQVRDLLIEQKAAIEHQAMAVKQRDEFLSIASHELKTPITSMKLQVQMRKRFLKKGDPTIFSPEKVTSLIDFTATQLERLARLVDDMLDISRIVNGKLSLSCDTCELGALVEEVLEGFSSQFDAAGCAVDLRIASRVSGTWDRYRIEQVIANLFSNAIKYGAKNPVSVEVRSERGQAILKVKDHGSGIAPEDQERIFQRFERAVGSNNVSGLGLGLYITREILSLHHGTIRVESTLGQGSMFTVELPATAEMRVHAAQF